VDVSIVGESVEGLSVGARELCVLPIPAYIQSDSSGLHTAVRWRSAALWWSDGTGDTVHAVYRHRRCGGCGTCGGGCVGGESASDEDVSVVVRVGRIVRACLVQVAVVLGRIVRVPFTHKVLVFHALRAARVERAGRSLAVCANFHVLVVGLGTPVTDVACPEPRHWQTQPWESAES
jgi:hypothetical protein